MLKSPSSWGSKLFFAALVVVLGESKPALAASSASKEQIREREAKTACLSGDYAKGISILAELFVRTENPVHLFNQGRCYEQNVRYLEAAERFREFLRKAGNIPEDVKATVDQHIAHCDAAVAKSQPRSAAETVPAHAPPAEPTPPPAPSPPPKSDSVSPPPAATTHDSVSPPPAATTPIATEHPWQHTAKWIATGAAGAFVGLGVFEHLRYYSKNKDYNNDPDCYNLGRCRDLADAADLAKTVAIAGYSAGAVATGLAVWFWLADTPREPTTQHSGIGLTCAPTLTGATCGGRF